MRSASCVLIVADITNVGVCNPTGTASPSDVQCRAVARTRLLTHLRSGRRGVEEQADDFGERHKPRTTFGTRRSLTVLDVIYGLRTLPFAFNGGISIDEIRCVIQIKLIIPNLGQGLGSEPG